MSEAPRPEQAGAGPEAAPAHGIADWPFGANPWRDMRPDTLPDQRPWPRVRVLTAAEGAPEALEATLASVIAQAYPEGRHDAAAAGPAFSEIVAAALADPATDFLLFLRPGDLLAPGALSALCLEAALSGACGLRGPEAPSHPHPHPEVPQRSGGLEGSLQQAPRPLEGSFEAAGAAPQDEGEGGRSERSRSSVRTYGARSSGTQAVAGLRVLFDDAGVRALDALGDLDAAPGLEATAFTGGEILLAREAVVAAGGIDASAALPVAELWPRLLASGIRLARIGRPVLLQRVPDGTVRAPAPGLRIAALTDLGARGGAGIAHRRLSEALVLSGHAITPLRLADESPPAAAEWTDAFPRTEAAILERHDLVLAGNLHGATRSTALLGRLAREVPVATVLHDLFALTGRCAHPKGCTVIATGCDARCPSPDEYPQLAPDRIAEAYAGKRAVLASPHSPLLLANSDWTARQARSLAPPGTRVARITLPFPTGVFRPGDRTALRQKLGLPPDDVLVVFSAVIADAPDKGFPDLVAALRSVARPGVGFVALGRLDDPRAFGLPNLHAPGPIADETTLAEWYGACDLCLTASRLETLGQTPIEAGLCGVPSVAYRATGLTSAVIDGVTGILAAPCAGALAEALAALIADEPRRRRLGASARIVLENRYSHAAAALSLHEAFAGWDAMPGYEKSARIHFVPEMLGRFAFAAERHPGAAGTIAPASPAPVRALRRAKHALLGRGMPLWLRYALYAASRLRPGVRA